MKMANEKLKINHNTQN